MKIRGNVKISGDLLVKTQASTPEAGKVLYSADIDGKVRWGDVIIPDVITTKLYDENSIVVDKFATGDLFLAIIDAADGGMLLDGSKWSRLTNGVAATGGHFYEISSTIPANTLTADVGGVTDVYGTAGDFTPNVPVSAVLDAILFPTIIPSVASKESMSLSLKTSAGINVKGRMIEWGTAMDVTATISTSFGSWAPNGESLYLGASSWDFNMAGESRPNLAAPTTTKNILGTLSSYAFSGLAHLMAGVDPEDNKGVTYTGKPAKDISEGPVLVKFGFPILVASLPEKHDISDIATYLNRGMFAPVTNSDGLTITTAVTKMDRTAALACSLEYPHILVPATYGKSLTSFWDDMSSKDYIAEFDKVGPFNLGTNSYYAYVFKTATSISSVANRILITIG